MTLADRVVDAAGSIVDQQAFQGGIALLAEQITEAERFVFSAETKSAIGQLANSRPSSLLEAMPLCRLPHRLCWFEWPGDEVGRERGPAGTEVPRSFGVLLEGIGGSDQRVGVSFVWDFQPGLPGHPKSPDGRAIVNPCVVGFIVDWSSSEWTVITDRSRAVPRIFDGVSLSPEELVAANKLMDRAVPTVAPYFQGFVDRLRKVGREDKIVDLMRSGANDVQGELHRVMAALCLLNSKNCVDRVPSDLKKINRRRSLSNKKALLSYSTVQIALSRRDKLEAERVGATGAEVRQHLVRGHFKIRGGGVFWWRPHLRGNAALGQVKHTQYEVRP